MKNHSLLDACLMKRKNMWRRDSSRKNRIVKEYCCLCRKTDYAAVPSRSKKNRIKSLRLQCVVLVQLYRRVVRVEPVVAALLVVVATVVLVGHHHHVRRRGRWQRRTFGRRTGRSSCCFAQRFQITLELIWVLICPLLLVQLDQSR